MEAQGLKMFPCFTESDCHGNDCRNRPKHGFRRHLERREKRSEIMFQLGNPTAKLFQKLKFTQFVNRIIKLLGRRLYSPNLKDAAWLEDAQLIFLIFQTFVCKFLWVDAAPVEKKEYIYEWTNGWEIKN